MKHGKRILLIVLAEIVALIISFVITPLIASVSDKWVWVSVDTILLLFSHFFFSYFLRHERPYFWLIGVIVNMGVLLLLCNINNQSIINALNLYGIASVYSGKQNTLYQQFPYWMDCYLYSSLIFYAREIFAVPLYCITQSNQFVQPVVKLDKVTK